MELAAWRRMCLLFPRFVFTFNTFKGFLRYSKTSHTVDGDKDKLLPLTQSCREGVFTLTLTLNGSFTQTRWAERPHVSLWLHVNWTKIRSSRLYWDSSTKCDNHNAHKRFAAWFLMLSHLFSILNETTVANLKKKRETCERHSEVRFVHSELLEKCYYLPTINK